jgi:hypothetical protein
MKAMAIHIIAMICVAIYFTPVFWDLDAYAMWVPGFIASVLCIFGILTRNRHARLASAVIFSAIGMLALAMAILGFSVPVIDSSESVELFNITIITRTYGVVALTIGIAFMVLCFRMLLGKNEHVYFGITEVQQGS